MDGRTFNSLTWYGHSGKWERIFSSFYQFEELKHLSLQKAVYIGESLWIVVKHKRQSTVYKIDKISQSEKNTVKMTENMAMCETKETESPRVQTSKTPQTQRHRKISSCSTPFRQGFTSPKHSRFKAHKILIKVRFLNIL